MIFVTVGTHEQPFNRLVKYIDEMKKDGLINEEVVMQTGYCTYKPTHCTWQKLYSYQDMMKYIQEARIVITHGGPSSFIAPLQIGKIPIVVPRRREFNEHVNDHQVFFCHEVAERKKNIILVDNIENLITIIIEYDEIVSCMPSSLKSNNSYFCNNFQDIVLEVLRGK